jgi:4-hydroxyphenylpyruvate dioxygenase
MDEGRKAGDLGILGWDRFEYVVQDLKEAQRFYFDKLGVAPSGRLSRDAAAREGEDALLLRAGSVLFSCHAPRNPRSRAGRWLARHPEGIRTLAFRVKDLERTRRVLEERSATFTGPRETGADSQGRPVHSLEIATPLGDVRFRFVERPADGLPAGFEPVEVPGGSNPFSLQVIDHVTSNLLTLEPWVTWLRDVLGFEEYWRVRFHTSDVRGGEGGTGLASIVMWDPGSGVKMANNEPLLPNFESSQIYAFVEENRGPGVQHVAFHLPDIVGSVEQMRRRGMEFLETPGAYYEMLPGRMRERKVTNFKEEVDRLKALGILVDGADDKYLLQIFSVEGKTLHANEQGGPFFYEFIQRRGARGFGEGNFRALFESIEREQELRAGPARHPWAGT